MPETGSFDYAVLRVVPRVEREEFLNVGVILFSRVRKYLAAKVELDEARLLALDPTVDLATLRDALAAYPRIAAGDPEAGPLAELSPAERFHWLTAPRSTIIQPSPVHSGQSDDLDAALEELMEQMVRPLSDATEPQ